MARDGSIRLRDGGANRLETVDRPTSKAPSFALGAKRITGIALENNGEGRAFWNSAGYRLDSRVTRYINDLS